ncbi:MAG: cbb3-type cytochrome c oxidase subunit 3 [Ignavibacteriales bacterium]|nr:cbb3-type cytochrome c oxidase subunit 3 [Ignavibacteriales bacterium]MCF8306101.1 cbb3-type cytochrome c oxidase subunit 3 [Ignavibacteriales bacterium]MCF8315844.1 cbb3-type cytochrome c oxidase subunit 3 [Ignavibacteriales bacterium]MCF8437304.1 cbb3-type cytochrome c oxidase subunit 3 [Ignavibacteriales bacterium]
MFSKYLSSIKDIEVFPIISLILFFLVFVAIIIWIVRMDKTYLRKMENLPLEEDHVTEKTQNSGY